MGWLTPHDRVAALPRRAGSRRATRDATRWTRPATARGSRGRPVWPPVLVGSAAAGRGAVSGGRRRSGRRQGCPAAGLSTGAVPNRSATTVRAPNPTGWCASQAIAPYVHSRSHAPSVAMANARSSSSATHSSSEVTARSYGLRDRGQRREEPERLAVRPRLAERRRGRCSSGARPWRPGPGCAGLREGVAGQWPHRWLTAVRGSAVGVVGLRHAPVGAAKWLACWAFSFGGPRRRRCDECRWPSRRCAPGPYGWRASCRRASRPAACRTR